MDQVITFDKSLQERLQEYRDLFSSYDILPVSAIKKEWGFYLELTLETSGWHGIWKIHRQTCEALNIPFPTVVIVVVISVNFIELTARVKVLAVQDDIHVPDRHHVPLMHLWPMKEDKSVPNLQLTANTLDMLRFFYNYILMPWDYEDDDTMDWKTHHLESRLQLYYDMKNGVIPRHTAEHSHCLMMEAKRLEIQRQELEGELGDSDGYDEGAQGDDNNKVQSLLELQIRMMEIKAEMDVLENPFLREAIIRKHKQMYPNTSKQNTWAIMNHITASTAIQFLSTIKQLHCDETLQISPNLLTSLDYANANDIFILSEANHTIKSTGALEHGGTLKGISNIEKTILTLDVMMDFSGDTVDIANLTIDAVSPQCAIIVRRGQLTLTNCKLIGDGKSSTHRAIIVLNGAKLVVTNCEISNFYTGIVGNSGSVITVENGEIFDCSFGVTIFDNCALTALKTTIRSCKKYGVCLETENSLDNTKPQVGNFDILNIIPKLQFESIGGNNNVNGDAAIVQKSKVKFVEDGFAISGPTVDFDEEIV